MFRAVLLTVLSVASAVASLSLAGATAAARTRSGPIPPAIATGPQGRALLAWGSLGGVRVRERNVLGSWGPVSAVSGPQVYPELAVWGPGDAVAVVAFDQSENVTGTQPDGFRKLVVFRRAPGAQSFAAPTTVTQAPALFPSDSAADASGNIAIVARLDQATTMLFTAAGGGAWAAPQELASNDASVAVGGDGRVVVAYYDWERRGLYVRTGKAGAAIGEPRLLSARRTAAQDIVAAIDGAGNATVAFTSEVPHDRYGRSALVAARSRPNRRFGPLAVVARGGSPGTAGFGIVDIAAAGATTVLLWDPNPSGAPHPDDGRLRVAIARGAGRFARPQTPTSPAVDGGTAPWAPVVAVNDAGDVLLTYGYRNAVHASRRLARDPRFGAPRVISTLGSGRVRSALQGATPAAALLTDHRPLIVYDNLQGAMIVRTTLRGRRPDLTAPRATVKLPRSTTSQLLATNAFSATISCSEACVVQGHATLRTDTGRSSFYDYGGNILRRGETLTKRFAFDPTRKAGRVRANARVNLTFTMENGSGATATTVTRIRLGPR